MDKLQQLRNYFTEQGRKRVISDINELIIS